MNHKNFDDLRHYHFSYASLRYVTTEPCEPPLIQMFAVKGMAASHVFFSIAAKSVRMEKY